MGASKPQCQARTKSGSRCKKSASEQSAFCSQHSRLLKDCLWAHPGGKINYVPEPPPVLSENAAGFWKQYCGLLVEKNKMMGVYLGDLSELCWRIDFRTELETELETHGLINEYESGSQLIGIDKIIDRNDKRITDLKKQFGLTLDTAHKLNMEPKPSHRKDEEKASPGKLRVVGKDF